MTFENGYRLLDNLLGKILGCPLTVVILATLHDLTGLFRTFVVRGYIVVRKC